MGGSVDPMKETALIGESSPDAQVVHHWLYLNRLRHFPEPGKRTRAERLAEIEHLYDRHVVGPAILDAEAAESLPSYGPRHEVIRMQPYGPQGGLRKLIFVGPTLVRSDRLGL